MEIITSVAQVLVICIPVIIAVVKYLDYKSAKRQKVLQDSMFLILQGLDCIGNLSKCTANDFIKGSSSKETEEALKCYGQFSDSLKTFKSKVTSTAV